MSEKKIRLLTLSDTIKPFELYTGDNGVDLIFELTDENDVAIDLSSLTANLFRLTARQSKETAVLFTINAAFVTDGTDGKIKFTFTSTETANALDDALLELVDNNAAGKDTLEQFKFNIFDSIQ